MRPIDRLKLEQIELRDAEVKASIRATAWMVHQFRWQNGEWHQLDDKMMLEQVKEMRQ